jgi:hypothetical protein
VLQAWYPNPYDEKLVRLAWIDNSTNEDGFEISVVDEDGQLHPKLDAPANVGTGSVTFEDNAVDGQTITYAVQSFFNTPTGRRYSKSSNHSSASIH